MTMYTKQSLKAHVDKTLKQRLEGNEQLLAGDLQGALKTYHLVLLSLRGLESAIQNLDVPAKSEEDSDESSSEEEGEGQKEKGDGGGGGGDSKGKRSAETKTASEPTQGEKVKSAILNTHLNMANIYIKQEKWQKALRAAEAAQRLHSDHPKAVFREAQARLGLGETYTGRKMLTNLQKKHPDKAITAALQKLELDEKARQKKADLQFRGIFAAKSKAFAAKKSDDGDGGSGGAQITEIVEDVAAEPSNKGASTSVGGNDKQAAPESPAGTSTSEADAASAAAA